MPVNLVYSNEKNSMLSLLGGGSTQDAIQLCLHRSVKIMKSLKFRCIKFQKIMNFNENGKGQGTYSRECVSDVITQCKCGEEFKGQFSQVFVSVRQLVENECL